MPSPQSSPTHSSSDVPPNDLASLKAAFDAIQSGLTGVIVGRQQVIEQCLIAILARGHCLLEGAPGTAKSLIAESLAQSLGLDFQRVRCTPDLTPAEIARAGIPHGSQNGAGAGIVMGPIFANVVLVDDIDRLAPKTNALFQQAIQQRTVEVDDRRYALPDPFVVLATKYPDEEEAPDVPVEPRDDRFLFKIAFRYPEYHDEYRTVETATAPQNRQIERVLSAEQVIRFQQLVRRVEVSPPVIHYAVRLVRATRVHQGENPDFIYQWVRVGAGPRAAHYLALTGQVRAALYGRSSVTVEDLQAVVRPVLRHRIITNRNARSTGVSPDRVIDRLLYEIPERVEGDETPPGPGQSLVGQQRSAADLLDE